MIPRGVAHLGSMPRDDGQGTGFPGLESLD